MADFFIVGKTQDFVTATHSDPTSWDIPKCCGDCARWSLDGSPLRAHGYGTCSARPDHLRPAFTTSEMNVCRLGKFQPKDNE